MAVFPAIEAGNTSEPRAAVIGGRHPTVMAGGAFLGSVLSHEKGRYIYISTAPLLPPPD